MTTTTTKTKGINKKKLTLREFIWYGFNFTASAGFVGGYAILSNPGVKGSDGSYVNHAFSVGLNAVWVLILVGLIAAICAWSFAKLSRVHKTYNNGAAYIYARATWGRLLGFFVAFIQYVSLPFLITLQILFLLRGNFLAGYTGGESVLAVNWGAFTSLYLDIIGIIIYLSAASVVFIGMKAYKLSNNWASAIKWGTTAFLLIAAFVLCIQHGAANYKYWTSEASNNNASQGGERISFQGIIQAFNATFFYFAGFETFSTSGRNIENPERNIGLGIMITMIVTTTFYIIVSLIYFGAFDGSIGANGFKQNMNIATWLPFKATWLAWAGAIIMLVSSLGLKVQAAAQNALFGGTTLQPLAKEGYISDNFRKLNADNIPVRSCALNLGITSFCIILWLIVPDLVIGGLTASGASKSVTNSISTIFSVRLFTAASSAITLFVYGVVILTTLRLAHDNKVRMKIWEWIVFPIGFVSVCFFFGYHYYNVFANLAQGNLVWFGSVIELCFILGAITVGLCIYFLYYTPKYKFRLERKPELQQRLDNEFQVQDDWAYVSLGLKAEIDNYLKRNGAIYNKAKNDNYDYAQHIQKELKVVTDKFEQTLKEERARDAEYIDE